MKLKSRTPRSQVQSVLRIAHEMERKMSVEGYSPVMAEKLALECEKAKVAVRSWPNIFEELKQIIRHSRKENWNVEESRRWSKQLIDAAVSDRFLVMLDTQQAG